MTSADYAKQATITFDQWCANVMARKYTIAQLHATRWYKAGKALESEAHAPPLPATPLGRRCVYFSAVTDGAAHAFAALGHGYTALITADPHPAYVCTDAQLAVLRSGGGKVFSWCDGDQTLISAAARMAHDRGLDGFSGQYETDAQWEALIKSGAPLGIGNPSALSPGYLAAAKYNAEHGDIALIGEVMNPDPTYSAQGVPISSACFYLDRDQAQGGYVPLTAYSVMPASMRHSCSIYTGGVMHPEDWALYKSWTM